MAGQSYRDIDVIVKAIEVMSNETEGRTEDKVARYMTGICSHYFPVKEGWTIVPESRTPDGKIPDLVVERWIHDAFVPKIYVELKSKVSSSSIPDAIKQLATALLLHFGDGDVNEGFLVVVRGTKIAFLEYIAYLDSEDDAHFCRTIPFNRLLSGIPKQPNRPTYKGETRYKFPDSRQDTYVLDVVKDHAKVHEVITWMKHNKPREIPDLIDSGGYGFTYMTSRVNSAQGSKGIQPGRRYRPGLSPVPPRYSDLEPIQVKKGDERTHSSQDYLCDFDYLVREGTRKGVLYVYPGSRSFSIMEEDDERDAEMS